MTARDYTDGIILRIDKTMNSRRKKLSFIFLLLFIPIAASIASADRTLKLTSGHEIVSDRRIALIIGNSSYKTSPLKNPVNDAEDIAYELERLGFKVQLGRNMNKKAMFFAIRKFGIEIKQGGVGLFYYAGHGMQVNGNNFLIPIGADIQSEEEVEYEAIDAGLVLRKMEAAGNPMNIVILDACRDNPFARSFRSAQKGLAQMDAPSGTLIVYATAPGSVAADGTGRNGIFTRNFLGHVRDPDLEIGQMLKRVRAGVQNDTDGQQVPWESSSLVGDFYFAKTNSETLPGKSRSANNDLLDRERQRLDEEKRELAEEKIRFQNEKRRQEETRLAAERRQFEEDKRRFEDQQRETERMALAEEKRRLVEERRRLQVARAEPGYFSTRSPQGASWRSDHPRGLPGYQKYAPMLKNAKELIALVQQDLAANAGLPETVVKEFQDAIAQLKSATIKAHFKSTHDGMQTLKKLALDRQLGDTAIYRDFAILTADQSIEIARQQNRR